MSTKSPTTAPTAPSLDGATLAALDDDDIEGSGDIIAIVRQRLAIDDAVSDVTVAASLAAIAAHGDQRGRWLAAFGSPLGRHLAARGDDLGLALANLVALGAAHAD